MERKKAERRTHRSCREQREPMLDLHNCAPSTCALDGASTLPLPGTASLPSLASLSYASPVIDTSTPETLERDFYAWLHARPQEDCSSAELSYHMTLSPLPPIDLFGHFSRASYSHSCTDISNHEAADDVIYTEDGPDEFHYIDDSPDSTNSSVSSTSSIENHPPDSSSSCVSNTPTEYEKAFGKSAGRNQLGRTYSPGLPLSMADRQHIVQLYQDNWKICDISRRLCVTHSCVSKILNRYKTTGSVRPKEAKEGRTESPLVTAIRDYQARLGMCRQSEIREQYSPNQVGHQKETRSTLKKSFEYRLSATGYFAFNFCLDSIDGNHSLKKNTKSHSQKT